ncbi:MAG: hypothetical protein OXN88_09640 [Chloroflexota bacterium]|nr:hypothetical protein [Chloroflexota bacterium]
MRVVKYWRNRALRYRLVKMTDGVDPRRAASAVSARKDAPRKRQAGIEQAKVLS